MNKIAIINDCDGDMAYLFVNGKFVHDEHQFYVRDLAKYTPIESIEEIDLEDHPAIFDYLADGGSFDGMTLEEVLNL